MRVKLFTLLFVMVLISCNLFKTGSKTSELTNSSHALPNLMKQNSAKADNVLLNLDKTKNLFKLEQEILDFKNGKDLEKLALYMATLSDDQIEVWQRTIGFNSLNKFHNMNSKSEDIDDSEYDKKRIPDPVLEYLLNENGEIKIGDKHYRISNDVIYTLNEKGIPATEEKIRYNNSYSRENNRFCGTKKTFCERLLNGGDNKIVGKKWVLNFFWSSIGARTVHYKKNWRGKYKRRKTDKIHLYIDQWHELCYTSSYGSLIPGIVCVSDDLKMKSNSKKVKKIYYLKINLPEKLCVTKFGRVHHWNNENWDLDCHNESWW